jgi:hypothetical protein
MRCMGSEGSEATPDGHGPAYAGQVQVEGYGYWDFRENTRQAIYRVPPLNL